MGRLWQTLLLKEYSAVFEYIPIESVVKERQVEYYRALSGSDKSGSSTLFIEFMLGVIDAALADLLRVQRPVLTGNERILLFKEKIGTKTFTRLDYLNNFKEISPATASRDIRDAVVTGILNKTGDKRTSRYRFI
jgi:Fic family protein